MKHSFLAFSRSPGGFRELRETHRKQFLPSCLVSYGQKPVGDIVYRLRYLSFSSVFLGFPNLQLPPQNIVFLFIGDVVGRFLEGLGGMFGRLLGRFLGHVREVFRGILTGC